MIHFGSPNTGNSTVQSVVDTTQRKTFTPTSGQTEFLLDDEPTDVSKTELFVGRIFQSYGVDYEIDGKKLRWLGKFRLEPYHLVDIKVT